MQVLVLFSGGCGNSVKCSLQ